MFKVGFLLWNAVFTVLVSILFVVALAYAEPQCPTAQETDWSLELLLPHDNCNKFYKCTFGQPIEQQCYNGLYFNLETWQCDWPFNVYCGERTLPDEDKGEESLPEQEAEVEEEEAPEPEEEVVEEEEATEKEEAAEEQEAVEEAPEETVEEEEAVEEAEEADEEEEAAKEENGAEEEEAVEEEERAPEEEDVEEEVATQPEIEFQENGCPVNPHVHWLLPHEEDCNAFYDCVWGGEKVLRQCAATLHFNRDLQVCDWPVSAGCSISANKHHASRVAYRSFL